MKPPKTVEATAPQPAEMQPAVGSSWDRLDGVALVFLLSLTLLRLALAASFPLVSDETYYRLWADHLSFSYLDHPPMVAWLIALSQSLFGPTELGVRFFAPVLLGIGGWWWYCSVKPEAGFGALFFVVGLQLCPLVHGVGVVMTPDVPFLFFLGAVVVLYRRRVISPQSWQPALLGGLVGLGMLSKLSMVPLAVLWFIQAPELRTKRHSLLYAIGLTVPILLWQIGAAGSPHESGPLVFQLDRFLDVHFTPFGPFEFIGAWALVALPILGVAVPYGLYGQFINPTTMTLRELGPLALGVLYVLLLLPGTILGFFEANWLLPALLLLAFGTSGYWFKKTDYPLGKHVYALHALAALPILLVVHLFLFTWPSWPDWTTWGLLRHAGWEDTTRQVEDLAQQKPGLIRVPHYEELGQFCRYGSKAFCERLRLSGERGEALNLDDPTPWCLDRLDENDIRRPEAVIKLGDRFLRAYRLSSCSDVAHVMKPTPQPRATETP